METGTVRARSGGCLPRWKASTNISMAWPVLGGIKMVAARRPLLTQAWPVWGRPSQPRNGKLSQRSFSVSSGNSSKALRAPMAMESSWAATRSMAALREVVSFNQDRKSTRLNSSHSQISYAVFCLKKTNHRICLHVAREVVRFYLAVHRSADKPHVGVCLHREIDRYIAVPHVHVCAVPRLAVVFPP